MGRIPTSNPINRSKEVKNSIYSKYKSWYTFPEKFERRFLELLDDYARSCWHKIETQEEFVRQTMIKEEWMYISRVIDRFWSIIVIVVLGIFLLYFNYSSPFDVRFEYCPLGPGKCTNLTREMKLDQDLLQTTVN